MTTPHDVASILAARHSRVGDMNEATTRHRLIDAILHDVLSWPRSAVQCESFISPGFADYVLLGRQGRFQLFIEAKREGEYFNLTRPFNENDRSAFIKVKELLTDDAVREAVEQVRQYCVTAGCEYAAVTNGIQWIFFKTFERQHDWRKLTAFVIRDLLFFSDRFVEATKHFAYVSITEHASLPLLLGVGQAHHRDVFYTKSKIASYNQEVRSNHLAPFLRPFADRYLGTMDAHDDEFMERCYVNMREYQTSVVG